MNLQLQFLQKQRERRMGTQFLFILWYAIDSQSMLSAPEICAHLRIFSPVE
jgi:hypothetical protein